MQNYGTKLALGYIATGTMIITVALATGSGVAAAVATFAGLSALGSVAGSMTSATLADLRRQTVALREGNLDQELSSNRSDEFGDLYRAIDDLRQSLRSRIQQRERKRRALKSHVESMLSATERLADGDLTVRIDADAKGEIGRLFEGFNEAVSKMQAAMQEVHSSAADTGATAGRVNESVDRLYTGAEEQSEQTTEVAGAMEEMSRTIVENSRSLTQTVDASRSNREIARTNGQTVLEAIEKMEDIGGAVEKAAGQIEELYNQSEKIEEIVETIAEIADQTDLLALNASVEAARAADGDSFAVVADEIRDLASRASKATDEIGKTVNGIQAKTQAAFQAMETSQREVRSGIQLTEEAREALDEIVEGAETIEGKIEEIASATEEQSTTSDQISQSIESIAAFSDQNANSMKKISEMMDDLKRASVDTQRLIEGFRFEQASENRREHEARSQSRGSKNINPENINSNDANLENRQLPSGGSENGNGMPPVSGKEASEEEVFEKETLEKENGSPHPGNSGHVGPDGEQSPDQTSL